MSAQLAADRPPSPPSGAVGDQGAHQDRRGERLGGEVHRVREVVERRNLIDGDLRDGRAAPRTSATPSVPIQSNACEGCR